MEVDTEPTGPQRVQELWFEDGNLVIQAGNSQFRVYRGILAAHSPVFQDMLSFPQPPDSELVEGCPLVRLPDTETEVTDFLKAIFVPEYFPAFPSRTDFDTIVGCLRLSHKYGVDYLRRRALVHLSSAYHTTLAEGDASLDSDSCALKKMSWTDPDNSLPYEIFVIELAREVDVLWILPAAFYELSNAYSRGKLGREIFHGAVYKGISTNLSAQDQLSFSAGHRIQSSTTTASILQFLSNPLEIAGCTSITPHGCTAERLRILGYSLQMNMLYPFMPLDVWGTEDWEMLENVCPTCLTVLRRKHQDARQAFWDMLPDIYGLPPWDELITMKVAAIGADLFC
ncbi:hypothetical protein FB451DRAFT_1124445 [Mycena latifolia]|nr:hypothetical protein FB451DRAFT_1124445 [Mycena latifolia]